MAEAVYRGRGAGVPYNEYITLINEVFGFGGVEQDFRTLLPKLYRPPSVDRAMPSRTMSVRAIRIQSFM